MNIHSHCSATFILLIICCDYIQALHLNRRIFFRHDIGCFHSILYIGKRSEVNCAFLPLYAFMKRANFVKLHTILTNHKFSSYKYWTPLTLFLFGVDLQVINVSHDWNPFVYRIFAWCCKQCVAVVSTFKKATTLNSVSELRVRIFTAHSTYWVACLLNPLTPKNNSTRRSTKRLVADSLGLVICILSKWNGHTCCKHTLPKQSSYTLSRHTQLN